jgi:iron complex outermembrane receptor protein
MRLAKYLGAASVGAMALAMHGTAWAAAADATAGASATSLDEIVVTARRREERLQDVPISVAAINGDQLERRGVRKLDDLMNAFAGVKIEVQNSKTSTPQIVLRGQRMYGVLAAQDSPTAFYFADAIVLPVQGFNAAMYDLSSVQVLKGPQGTLFGRNTTGGAIVINPAKPTDTTNGSLSLTAGNYAMFGAQGFYNAHVNDDLDVRLSAYYNKHAGYDTYASPQPAGQKGYADKVFDTRLSVVWKPTNNLENYTVGYYSRLNSTNIPVTIVAVNPNGSASRYNGTGIYAGLPTITSEIWNGQGNPRKHVYSDIPQNDETFVYGGVNTTTLDTGLGFTVKNIASYRDVKNHGYINISGASVPITLTYQNAVTNVFSDEFQLSGKLFDDRVNWVGGLYYVRETSTDEQQAPSLYFPPLPTNIAPFYSHETNQSYAAYIQATAKITDKLSFTAGVRNTQDKRAVHYMHQTFDRFQIVGIPFVPRCTLVNNNGVALSVANCSLYASKTFTQPTYNLSLDYHLTPDTLLYVTQRTGYRSGGLNQRAATAAQRVPFSPENELDREVGLKTEFRLGDWSFRADVDYYHDRYKNLQKSTLSLVNGLLVTSIFNVAAGVVQGAEAEFQVKPIQALTLGATYAYTDARYTKYPFIVAGVTRDFSDRHFAGIPKDSFDLYFTYNLPLDPSLGTVSLSGDYSYQGSSYISDSYQSKQQISILYTAAQQALLPDSDRPYKMRSYHLINARLEWSDIQGKPITLAIYGKNLSNENPEIFNNPGYEGIGITAVGIGPPRTFGAEVTYKF